MKVTTPAGTETTVSRPAWDHTYQYREGWKLVPAKPRTPRRKKAE